MEKEELTQYAQMSYTTQKSLEEAISDSYTILMVTFVSSEKSSEIENLSYYDFTVIECLKGSIPSNETITVEIYDEVAFVDNKSFYEKGEDYIILLSKFESVYVGDKYMPNGNFLISLEKDSINEIYQKGNEYDLEDEYTVSKFKTLLKTSLDKTDSYGKALGTKYTASTKADEIAKYSDLIIEAKIIENCTPEGLGKNGVGIYSIEILDVKKGTCTGLDAIYLFSKEANLGEEYLFLISYPAGEFHSAYSLSSKNSCIPISDTETYEEYMQYIENDPEYKLHESIRKRFRPEWVWNEEIKDYENVERLERDSETGLFILPEPRKELEEYATWDGKLGLYISNDIKINHETGEVNSTVKYQPSIRYPDYEIDDTDEIDKKYMELYVVMKSKYESNPVCSVYYQPLYLLEQGEVEKDVFIVDIKDINRLKPKLTEGMQTDFVMTMIQLTTQVKMENVPSLGASYRLKYWLEEYNQLIETANKGFDAEEAEKLGVLSLPYIGEQVKAGNYDAYKEALMSLAEGYGGKNDKIDKPESYEKAVEWFEYYKDDIDTIKEFIGSELEADWLYIK